jgi:hypothetical protein
LFAPLKTYLAIIKWMLGALTAAAIATLLKLYV